MASYTRWIAICSVTLLFYSLIVSAAQQRNSDGKTQTLVLLDNLNYKYSHSTFFEGLKGKTEKLTN